jgi:DUF1680 family protein
MLLYSGPSELTTSIQHIPITIKENTHYPFGNQIIFKIAIQKSTRFKLFIKKPEGVDDFVLNMPFENREGFLIINRIWKNGDELLFQMKPEKYNNIRH